MLSRIADLHGDTQPTVSRNIHNVIALSAHLNHELVSYPLATEQAENERIVYQKQGSRSR